MRSGTYRDERTPRESSRGYEKDRSGDYERKRSRYDSSRRTPGMLYVCFVTFFCRILLLAAFRSSKSLIENAVKRLMNFIEIQNNMELYCCHVLFCFCILHRRRVVLLSRFMLIFLCCNLQCI